MWLCEVCVVVVWLWGVVSESISAVLVSNQSAVCTAATHLTRVMWPHGFSFPEFALATHSLFALFCEHNNYSDVPPAHLRISQHLTLWIGSVQTPLFVVVDAILRKSRLMCDLPCHRGRSGNQIGSFPTAWFWTRISGSSHCSCNCSVLVSLFSEPDPSHVE